MTDELRLNWKLAKRREPLQMIASGVERMIRGTDARHVHGFVVWVQFNDGTNGEVDLSGELYGQVFEPLQESDIFIKFKVDPEVHTLTWPNGADFAPEFLHNKVAVAA